MSVWSRFIECKGLTYRSHIALRTPLIADRSYDVLGLRPLCRRNVFCITVVVLRGHSGHIYKDAATARCEPATDQHTVAVRAEASTVEALIFERVSEFYPIMMVRR